MKQIRDRVAGLDVHRDTVVACCRVRDPEGQVEVSKRSFATTRNGLAGLAAFLADHSVQTVAIEATGVYWKAPVRHEAPFDLVGMRGPHLRAVAAAC